ncbi:MAG TPA: hypothetical protein PLF01_05580, partial [Alphaproteobacteria bacterium]|nr:hypothetical protein [Alphaproteobacteria bacterium]
SFAIDELVSLADKHGVMLSTDCSGVKNPKNGELTTEHLRAMLERRDFQVTHECAFGLGFEMKRAPRTLAL